MSCSGPHLGSGCSEPTEAQLWICPEPGVVVRTLTWIRRRMIAYPEFWNDWEIRDRCDPYATSQGRDTPHSADPSRGGMPSPPTPPARLAHHPPWGRAADARDADQRPLSQLIMFHLASEGAVGILPILRRPGENIVTGGLIM